VARLDDLLRFIDSPAPSAAALRPHRQAMLDYRSRYGA
jgi:predicted nucleic acid-binding Zn ribbon protein